ncbi:MAG TPA: UDP-3-O-(3-hydroxymyristoyl)glucosamine N-acyltransferase [Burkholderiales bacterium]
MTLPAGYRLDELAALCEGEVAGDGTVVITQVAPLHRAGPQEIGFISRAAFRGQLAGTSAGAVIIPPELREHCAIPRIVTADPYACFARVSALLNPPAPVCPGVHPAALVDEGAAVDPGARIGAAARIARGACVGAGTLVADGCSIGEEVRIGQDCRIHPGVVIYSRCVLGDRVVVHSGAVIGADGFGFAPSGGRWIKIPQIGRVVIGDDVEIGANTTIDRGTMDDTVIEEGVILDNQIQVGHNCRIGAFTAIAGCVGIAGSTRIGRHCLIGGAAMIGGHLEIADKVVISGASTVPSTVDKPGQYTSIYPLAPHREWLKMSAQVRQLDRLAERVRRLEEKLAETKGKET